MTAKPRVAIVHNIVPPYRVPLLEALARDPRFELRVLFMARTEKVRSWRVPEQLGFPHEFLPGLHLRLPATSFTLHMNPSVLGALARFDPDAIVVGGWDSLTAYLAALAKNRGRPRRLVLWSESNAVGKPPVEGLRAAPKRWIVRRSDAALVPGRMAQDYLRRLGGGALPMEPFPNVVDTSRFALPEGQRGALRRARRASLGVEGTTFLFLGQLVERKGIPELLEAFGRAAFGAPATLLLVGEGPLRGLALAQAAASRPGRRIVVEPYRQIEELAAIYAAADALVLPSREDPWPLVVVEAMTAGLPVLASDAVGNGPELVLPGRTGFAFRAGDPADLAECLARAAAADLPALGAHARLRVAECCSIARCADALARAVTPPASG